ncbi:putative oxidoreductase [Aulographum hederae CBS 113979]|uniref:Putative oxidoreductase n=1 Tax=Aulographum hederae CBS 113979 TaxID=1176131 RepID=A0A6G1H3Q2_9PEZI|nr:putative oxidoreductase [Aulographum hederae CBS 113979]
MATSKALQTRYPWTQLPLIISAPMRLITGPELVKEVHKAGGLPFLASGTDTSTLPNLLGQTAALLPPSDSGVYPFGVGFINWGATLSTAVSAFKQYTPAAVWFFGPSSMSELVTWATQIREVTVGKTEVWVQVGTVASAVEVTRQLKPDALILQGSEAGGHGLVNGTPLNTLVPEAHDALKAEFGEDMPTLVAAGGIVEGRGAAAALTLGAAGVVMGTRFLCSPEANLADGYRKSVLDASDGGVETVRTSVYDQLRGTTGWPKEHNARGLINLSYTESLGGLDMDENKKMYDEALQKDLWGKNGRLAMYAGTGVGLIKEIKPAKEIVEEVRRDAVSALEAARERATK